MSEYKDYVFTNNETLWHHGYIYKPLLSILDPLRNKTILDLGCGNGWLVNLLIEQGFNAYGTDASVSGINIARKKNPDRFFIQDLSKDDLPDEIKNLKFDTIISTEVIEHLYSPSSYLAFCKKILKRSGEGELIITTPYHGYLKNLVLALSGKMDSHFTVHRDGGHIKFFSRKTLTHALEKENFKVQQFIGCGRAPYLWKSMLIKASI